MMEHRFGEEVESTYLPPKRIRLSQYIENLCQGRCWHSSASAANNDCDGRILGGLPPLR